jgi:two-component system phosphate regulon response regulator PhoB
VLLHPIRTLLVQDRIPANLPVAAALRAMDVIEVVATVWTLERARFAMRMHAPELVLVDWLLAGLSASHMCQDLKSRLLAPKVMMLIPSRDPSLGEAAALAGADAVVAKDDLEAEFEAALETLFAARFKRPEG